MPDAAETVHATTVAFAGKAVLIRGASGSGKSALALELMARGALLVADDRTILTPQNGQVIASCPEQIKGRIEARFVGILAADPAPPTPLALVVDMDHTETERLPPVRTVHYAEIPLPLLHKVEKPHFAASILQYLRSGRSEETHD